jgi:predicted transglutaminase-like cysteine proteinase
MTPAVPSWERETHATHAPSRLRALIQTFRPQRVVMACLALGLAHFSAQAQTAYGVQSVDKQPRVLPNLSAMAAAWKRMLEASRHLTPAEKVEAVNRFFNGAMLFAGDDTVWGQADYWATPTEFMHRGRGDCEDFAIAKYVSLRMLGLSTHSLRLMYVHASTGGPKPMVHMVLGYFGEGDANAEPLILDNMVDSIRPLSARTDLSLVYSFNTRGLWIAEDKTSVASPTARVSRWRNLLVRMLGEGTLAAWSPSQMAELTAYAAAPAARAH